MPTKLRTSPRQSTYVFGRLNLVAQYQNYDEKYAILSNALKNNRSLPYQESEWSFTDIDDLDYNGSPVLSGFIVKSVVLRADQVDKGTHTLNPITLPDFAQAKSRFFLEVKSGLIAFQPSHEIKVDVFTNRFKSLVAHNEFMVEADIGMIDERFEVFEKMADFQEITHVSIIPHPSNPRRHDLWGSVDDKIKKLKATTVQHIIDGKSEGGGLSKEVLTADEDIKAKLAMAEDGYGKGKVKGIKDGRATTITTGKKPVSAKAFERDGQPKAIFEDLKSAFEDIDSRTEESK